MKHVDVVHTPVTAFVARQRVVVKRVGDIPLNSIGTVTRICTTGEAWVDLDERSKIDAVHPSPAGSDRERKVRVWPEECEMATKNHQDRRAAARESSRANALERVTIENFGKDHWSTFGYIETRCVDYSGRPNKAHLRCVNDRHPFHAHAGGDASNYPTRLRDGSTVPSHDDWDCIFDLIDAELLESVGSSLHPEFRLTERGTRAASQLRSFKASGGSFAQFVFTEEDK